MAPPRRFDHDRAVAMYAEGISYRQIARDLGVGERSVRFAIMRATRLRALPTEEPVARWCPWTPWVSKIRRP